MGVTADAVAKRPELAPLNQNRAWKVWDEPPASLPNTVIAFRLYFAASELAVRPEQRATRLWKKGIIFVEVSPPTAMGTIFTEITDARTPFGGAAGRPRRREGLHGRKDLVSTPLIWARPGSDCRRFGVGFKLGCEGLDSSFRRGGRLRCAR
jgi:hypothetical protein